MLMGQRGKVIASKTLSEVKKVLGSAETKRFPYRRFRNRSRNDQFIPLINDNTVHSQELQGTEIEPTDCLNVTCSNLDNNFVIKYKTMMHVHSGILRFTAPPISNSNFQEDMEFSLVWNATDPITNLFLPSDFVETVYSWNQGKRRTTCINCKTWIAHMSTQEETRQDAEGTYRNHTESTQTTQNPH
jgi:hypothetical protein